MKFKISKTKAYILSAIILFAVALIFDNQILAFFLSIQTPLVAGFMNIISFFGNFYIIPFVATAVILMAAAKKNKSKFLAASWISLALGVAAAFLLKIIIARPRPDLTTTLWDFSFPSWHAIGVFAILPLIDKKLQPYWLAFAILVSLSRIYLGLHYVSDVIGGAVIGYCIGLISLKFFNIKK